MRGASFGFVFFGVGVLAGFLFFVGVVCCRFWVVAWFGVWDVVVCCGTLWFVRVRVGVRLPEGLLARVEERAVVEGRTLTGMVERLLFLGLGTVVTERDGGGVVAESRRTVVDGARSDGEGDSRTPVSVASRSVTAGCGRSGFHRAGVFCKSCGVTP